MAIWRAASTQYIPTVQEAKGSRPERLLSSSRRVATELEIKEIVERFIAEAAEPALLDRGEEPLRLIAGQWELAEWSGRLTLQAWNADRNLTRRIIGLKKQQRDRLSLVTERFPKTEAELQIADLSVPNAREIERRMTRLAFRDRFALMLARDFPQWSLADVSAEMNLEESLSPVYVRAFLRRGQAGIAVMAAQPDSIDCGAVVPFGLIWLEYLRSREKRTHIGRLFLYAPAGRESSAAFRAAVIDPARAEVRLHVYDSKLRAAEVDPADVGNIDSSLPVCRRAAALVDEAPDLRVAGVDRIRQSDGSVRYAVRGLEFARSSGERLMCGVGRKTRSTVADAAALAMELMRVRNPDAEDRQHPLYGQNPEGWLEAQVRANPGAVDASLCISPLYGQVPIFGGRDRGVVDLLGVDHEGRLAVIELKASADLHLPFQALDYWLRVWKHLKAGDFERLGYFAGIRVRHEPPRILLIAPALEFHSTSETLIGFLKPEVEVVRIGLSAEWRKELKIVLRLRGAEAPC